MQKARKSITTSFKRRNRLNNCKLVILLTIEVKSQSKKFYGNLETGKYLQRKTQSDHLIIGTKATKSGRKEGKYN